MSPVVRLGPEARRAVVLEHLSGDPLRVVAKRHGVSYETVRRHVRDALDEGEREFRRGVEEILREKVG
jgi:DNA-directed RNA polymerase specialized sigma24 family protein